MRQLNNTYHYGMAGYLMDFGFGGFIGYGKGVSVGLVSEAIFKVGMCLPAGPYVTDDDVRYIVETIKANIL